MRHRPACLLFGSIVRLAILYIVFTDRTIIITHPVRSGDDDLPGAVREVDDKLPHQRETDAILILPVGLITVETTPPTIAQISSDGIVTLLQKISHIKCVVEHAPAIVGPSRIHKISPYFFAIDVTFVNATCRQVESRPADSLLSRELLSKHRCATGLCLTAVAV